MPWQSGQVLIDPKNVAENIRAKGIDLVGQYAIQIEWSDGHNTGIYNFRDLRGNCPCEACAAVRATGRLPQKRCQSSASGARPKRARSALS